MRGGVEAVLREGIIVRIIGVALGLDQLVEVEEVVGAEIEDERGILADAVVFARERKFGEILGDVSVRCIHAQLEVEHIDASAHALRLVGVDVYAGELGQVLVHVLQVLKLDLHVFLSELAVEIERERVLTVINRDSVSDPSGLVFDGRVEVQDGEVHRLGGREAEVAEGRIKSEVECVGDGD